MIFESYALLVLTTGLILLQYMIFALIAGRARLKGKVSAPATAGDEQFERAHRLQQNTLEQIVVVLPSLWLFSSFWPTWAAISLGLIFLLSRIIYAQAYLTNPNKRGPGFLLGLLATYLLLLGAIVGATMSFF